MAEKKIKKGEKVEKVEKGGKKVRTGTRTRSKSKTKTKTKTTKTTKSRKQKGGVSLDKAAVSTIDSMMNLGKSIFKEMDAIMNMGNDFNKATNPSLPNQTTPDQQVLQNNAEYKAPTMPKARV